MKPYMTLTWNIHDLAAALGLTDGDTMEYFLDGRRIGFLLERRILKEHPGWKAAPSESSGYDLVDDKKAFWEVRSITDAKGAYFTPSGATGKGRSYSEVDFQAKLSLVAGYLCCDITQFPNVPVYQVPTAVVRELHVSGMLRKDGSLSRSKFISVILPKLVAASR
jgi:hypothetical protein